MFKMPCISPECGRMIFREAINLRLLIFLKGGARAPIGGKGGHAGYGCVAYEDGVSRREVNSRREKFY
jgi:hypothetical protein